MPGQPITITPTIVPPAIQRVILQKLEIRQKFTMKINNFCSTINSICFIKSNKRITLKYYHRLFEPQELVHYDMGYMSDIALVCCHQYRYAQAKQLFPQSVTDFSYCLTEQIQQRIVYNDSNWTGCVKMYFLVETVSVDPMRMRLYALLLE